MYITISNHAKERIKNYNLTKEIVIKAVMHPDETVEGYAGTLVAHKTGEEAERQKHFPDITIRQNKVTITLTTPEANGLTYEDFKLAKIFEQLT